MEKQYQNHFAYTVIKRQGSGPGSVRVFDWRDHNDQTAPYLTLFIEIETSDKENEKIITTLSEVLSDQFFNAPTETVEFAFESALAKTNIAVKDTLLVKPKNWLNKIHILAAAGREQELHLSSVGRAHAFLVHREQIADVVAAPTDTPRGFAANLARTPNPVKLFSNIVSGRLLGHDALVITNEAVLDYLSPERIRKTAHDFEPTASSAKFDELLSLAPANKQFALAIIKRLAQPTVDVSPADEAVALPAAIMAEKQAKPKTLLAKKIKSAANNWGKTLLALAGHYGQTGLAAGLSGLSKVLEIIQNKLSSIVPRLGKLPRFILTLWRDQAARDYHFGRLKNNWQKRVLKIKIYLVNLPPQRKRVLAALTALTLLFAGSISWRAYDKVADKNKINYQNKLGEIAQKIDQAEASLIYRDEARGRELLHEINNLLSTLARGGQTEQNRYHEFKNKVENIQNTLDRKQVLGELAPWLTLPNEESGATGLLKSGDNIFYYNGNNKTLSKVDLGNSVLELVNLTNELRPFLTALPYDNDTLALIGNNTIDLVNVNNGKISNQTLGAPPAKISNIFAVYARNLYTFSREDNAIIRYRENEFSSPQSWLKESYNLNSAADIMIDGQIYLLIENQISTFSNGRAGGNINLSLSDKLGRESRWFWSSGAGGIFILDSEQERILHFSKKGDLYNQYLSPSLKQARAIVVDSEEKNMYLLGPGKIFRIEILPSA